MRGVPIFDPNAANRQAREGASEPPPPSSTAQASSSGRSSSGPANPTANESDDAPETDDQPHMMRFFEQLVQNIHADVPPGTRFNIHFGGHAEFVNFFRELLL